MMSRQQEITRFLDVEGWGAARIETLAADASFRKYYRLRLPDRQAVLMDAPPERENVQAFLHVAKTLRSLGLSVPEILAAHPEAGFLVLEDFGDQTYTRLLDTGADASSLYLLATDVLVALHREMGKSPVGLPGYSDDLMMEEAELFTDWYMTALFGKPISEACDSYREIWRTLLPLARQVPDSLVLRDFHVDNLIRLKGREGIMACGLLDFQDAVMGPVTYDFVSLVEDARRDVPTRVREMARDRYLASFPEIDLDTFDLSCALLGAQRHCKVLGIFTRLRDRDGKPGYLVHVPRLWRLLEEAVTHPVLEPLRHWLDDHFPPRLRTAPPIGTGE